VISFNAILRDSKIDPNHVKLVRHKAAYRKDRPSPYDLWLADDGRLELYQRIQRRPVFSDAKFIASFVVTPFDETIFIGLFKIGVVKRAGKRVIDPVSGKNVKGHYFYELYSVPALGDYRGRLVIDWGGGFRSWVQRAAKRDKRVFEIRQEVMPPPFPGFLRFRKRISELNSVPNSWREVFLSASGVYLLVHPKTGKQYVGSAYGSGGFWRRWEQYAASNHGGNKRMKEIPAADYQVSVLEIASSSSDEEAIIELENQWKEKLQSRKFGLNGN